MTKQKRSSYTLLTIIIAACSGASALAQAEAPALAQQYNIFNLDSLGGTNSRGNSINNKGLIAGYSNLPGDQSRHATLWQSGSIFDLGTLGGPNSSITWNVKNNRGLAVGISQTSTPEPLGEAWSSAAFYPGPNNAGFINLGFVWQNGVMRALPTLGGDNGFATSANNHGQVVGWAENTCHDPTCVPPQVLQFRPVVWGPAPNQIAEFPLIDGDTSGAATAINDRGQAVGISGICDQAVGRYTAMHAVLWENDGVTDIGNFGADFWNTPTAINEHGDIVGFAGTPGDPDGNFLRGFIWTRQGGIKPLDPLPNRTPAHVYSEADGVNLKRQVVGTSCDADFVDCRAVVWDQDGVATDLNDLKPASYTARLDSGKDINSRGEITGRATDDTGLRTTYKAVPVPSH